MRLEEDGFYWIDFGLYPDPPAIAQFRDGRFWLAGNELALEVEEVEILSAKLEPPR